MGILSFKETFPASAEMEFKGICVCVDVFTCIPAYVSPEYFSDNVRKSLCACMSAWMSQEYRAEHTKGEQGIACEHVCGLSWSSVRNLGQGRGPSEEEDIGLSPWTVSGQTGSKTHYAPLCSLKQPESLAD